ncbi:MAG: winged helix-turn-helix domain-containing protein [Rhodobacteraceae bacterium]|nr:winged helix-turn-helix domain-containing protein [Paracoccaceae bacterium]
MKYRFEDFVLDTDCAELQGPDGLVRLEGRVFDLLALLVANHQRLLSKDEIVDEIWQGRAISDATISTAIKDARRAIGDDGNAQRLIRTQHGRGFRFVGTVGYDAPAQAEPPRAEQSTADPDGPTQGTRPSIAILPFRIIGIIPEVSAIAEAIPTELISSLARLRWLRIVARGSSFRFHSVSADPAAVGQTLSVGYCLTGSVEISGRRVAIMVELVDTRTGDIVWAERFEAPLDEVHAIRADIVHHVVAALELHIPLHEAERARLATPASMDSWSTYHLGLQHMYRFNRADNEIAAHHLQRATELDPNFARAFAARSFTSFQNAFQKLVSDPQQEIANARRFAERALELDPIDPFCNFVHGRAQWLVGDPDEGQHWLDRAVLLSPNFAQGFYARGWTDAIAGRAHEALENVSTSIHLSPLDPFLYAMQSVRGIALMQTGDLDEAALWADMGARAPGAHHLIALVAGVAHKLNGDLDKANYWAARVRDRRADTTTADFFRAFDLKSEPFRRDVIDALSDLGF